MHIDEYTPDNISRAMGLPGFADDPALASSPRAFRILLKPSWSPEVCVTCHSSAEACFLEVRAFEKQLWAQPSLASCIPTVGDEVNVDQKSFDELFERVRSSVEPAEQDAGSRELIVDGMGLCAFVKVDQRSRTFARNACSLHPAVAFVPDLLLFCFDVIRHPVCRNALADAGRYVNLDLPTQEIPEPPFRTRLLVLGTENEREELLKTIRDCNRGKR